MKQLRKLLQVAIVYVPLNGMEYTLTGYQTEETIVRYILNMKQLKKLRLPLDDKLTYHRTLYEVFGNSTAQLPLGGLLLASHRRPSIE